VRVVKMKVFVGNPNVLQWRIPFRERKKKVFQS
jgi:hypothetical protein